MSADIHIDELHAYADGRLPATRRAAVEAYLAAHADAAAEVARWRAMNADLHRALDPLLNEPVPPRRIPAAIQAAARRQPTAGFGALRGWSTLALGVACMTIGAAAGWFSRGVAEVTVPMQRFANDALVSHVVFSPESKHVVEVPADEEAHLVTWLSRRLDAQLHIPDLTSLGYRLIGGRQTVVADAPTAMLMYEGPGGVRISVQLRRMPNNRDTGFRLETLPGQPCAAGASAGRGSSPPWRSTGRITAWGLRSRARSRARNCWRWHRRSTGSTASSPGRRAAGNSAVFFAMRCQVGGRRTTNGQGGRPSPHNEDPSC